MNLFLLAMINLKKNPANFSDDSSWTSYFHLSGLHGLPSIAWDGVSAYTSEKFLEASNLGREMAVPPTNIPNDPTAAGYCVHGTPLFCSWHRPYLVLFESILGVEMAKIADTWKATKKEQLRALALTFRVPYWDPIRKRIAADGVTEHDDIPLILRTKFVVVTDSEGKRKNVDNPLYDYAFPKRQDLLDTLPANNDSSDGPNGNGFGLNSEKAVDQMFNTEPKGTDPKGTWERRISEVGLEYIP